MTSYKKRRRKIIRKCCHCQKHFSLDIDEEGYVSEPYVKDY